MTYGGFNWKLNCKWSQSDFYIIILGCHIILNSLSHFQTVRWYRVPQRELDRRNGDRTLPVRSPSMAGGLFSIDKAYFNHLGKYDEDMSIWGKKIFFLINSKLALNSKF